MPFLGFSYNSKPQVDRKIKNRFKIRNSPSNEELDLDLNKDPGQEQLPLIELTLGKRLGEGAFGTVHLCEKDAKEKNGKQFALKTINLQGLDPAIQHSHMRLVKREVSALKKVGRLEGFEQIGDKIYILMPVAQGKPLAEFLADNKEGNNPYFNDVKEAAKIIKNCLNKLKELHDQEGIAHMDAHAGNLFVDKEGNVTPIDFGWSVDTHDNILFKYYDMRRLTGVYRTLRAPADSVNSNLFERYLLSKTDKELWLLYLDETFRYIKEHKTETALKVLTYGIMSIAAMHGLATYQVARIMAASLMRTLVYTFLVEYLSMELKLQESARCFPDEKQVEYIDGKGNTVMKNHNWKKEKNEAAKHITTMPVAILCCIYNNIYDNRESIDLLYRIGTAATTGDPNAVYEVLKKIDIEQAFNVALLYFPIHRIPTLLSNFYEEYFTSVESLSETCKKRAFAP